MSGRMPGRAYNVILALVAGVFVGLWFPGNARGELPKGCECIDDNGNAVECSEERATFVQCFFDTSYCGKHCKKEPISWNEWYVDINAALEAAKNARRLDFTSTIVLETLAGQGGYGATCHASRGNRGYTRTTRTLGDIIQDLGSAFLYVYNGKTGDHGHSGGSERKGGKGGAATLFLTRAIEDVKNITEPSKEGVISISGGGGGQGSCVAAASGGSGGDGKCAVSYIGDVVDTSGCTDGKDQVVQGDNASAEGGAGKKGGGGGDGATGGNSDGKGKGGSGEGSGKDGQTGIGGVGGTFQKSSSGYTGWSENDQRRDWKPGRGGNGANDRGGGGGGGFGGGGGGQKQNNSGTYGSGGGAGGSWTVVATAAEGRKTAEERDEFLPFFGKDGLKDKTSSGAKGNSGLTLQLKLLADTSPDTVLSVERELSLEKGSRAKDGGRVKIKGTGTGSWVVAEETVVVEAVLEEASTTELVKGPAGVPLMPMTLAMSRDGKRPRFEGEQNGVKAKLTLHTEKKKLNLKLHGATVDTPQACLDGEPTADLETRVALGTGPIREVLTAKTQWECGTKMRPVAAE